MNMTNEEIGQRRGRIKRKTLCDLMVAATGKRPQLLCLPMSLIARLLEAARNITKGCKKGWKEVWFLLFHYVKRAQSSVLWGKTGKQKIHHIQTWPKKTTCKTYFSSEKCGTLWEGTMLKNKPVYHSLPRQNCWCLEHYFCQSWDATRNFREKLNLLSLMSAST